MRIWRNWFVGLSIFAAVGALFLAAPGRTRAQTAASLPDETALSLVLPPLPDGSRPGVHLWARADQAQGPGGLPTVFLVTLYSKQTATGPEEHEVVNYLQYSGGTWGPARPRDDGTLLIDDWAWISLNLSNLSATAGGQGNASRYTVDYAALGSYAGASRQIALEEVYAADLSLVSSVVLSDTDALAGAAIAPATAVPAPTAVRSPSPGAVSTPVPAPASSLVVPPASTPASSPPRVVSPPPSTTPGLPVR